MRCERIPHQNLFSIIGIVSKNTAITMMQIPVFVTKYAKTCPRCADIGLIKV